MNKEDYLDQIMGLKPAGDNPEFAITGNSAEKTLKIFANIILICGILASFILLIVGIAMISDYEPETGWPLLISVIPVLLGSMIQWAFITVICNISNNLREINRKTK